jgi:hypothetical protein
MKSSLKDIGFLDIPSSVLPIENGEKLASGSSDLLCSSVIYVKTLYWVEEVQKIWEALIFDDLLGVYLFELKPKKPEIPIYHWIIVGPVWNYADLEKREIIVSSSYRGLPCAYIWSGYPSFDDPNAAQNPSQALESYCGVVENWINAVRRNGKSLGVFPVLPPELVSRKEYADIIEPLLNRIRSDIFGRGAHSEGDQG